MAAGGTDVSDRMVRRLDLVTAYGRLLALLGVPLVILLGLTPNPVLFPWVLAIVTVCMALVDAAPVVLLYLQLFTDSAALAFIIVDGAFALSVFYLGGSGISFFSFIPASAMAVRFGWAAGLGNAAALAAGQTIISLAKSGFRDVPSVLASVLGQVVCLIVTAALVGVLAEQIKREPPLNAEEVKARDAELKRWRAAADRARAIYEMAGMINATVNSNKILEAVLEVSTMGFEELTDQSGGLREHPAGAVFLFGQNGLYVTASRNIGYEEVDLTISGEQGVLHRVLSSAEPVVFGNLSDDKELRQFAAFRRCRSSICVPLRAGFDIYGAVVFASPVPDAFNEEHIELLTAIANQASVALANAQLYDDLQEEKEHIIAVEEEARNKLARDLHDGPTQSISAIAMRLNFSRLLLDRNPQKVKDELFKLENLARRTTKEIRTMLFTLRPAVLETQGLQVAVEQLVERLNETGDLPVIVQIDDLEDHLDVNAKAVAWFVTMEALNNAKKYAEADNVWVRMYIEDGRFVAEIEDDGKGFDFEATMANYDQRGSFGLLNLQERADLVNGRTTIESTPGKGTKVTLVIPLNTDVE